MGWAFVDGGNIYCRMQPATTNPNSGSHSHGGGSEYPQHGSGVDASDCDGYPDCDGCPDCDGRGSEYSQHGSSVDASDCDGCPDRHA